MKKSKLIRLIILAIACAFSFTAFVACNDSGSGKGETLITNKVYIDSVNGNDTNSGVEQTKAWRTLGKLSETEIPAGCTVYLNGEFKGTLSFKGSGKENAPITVTSFDKNNPAKIDGDGNSNVIILDGQSHIAIVGLEITLTADSFSARNGIFVTGDTGIVENISITDCYIHDIKGTHLSQEAAGNYWDSYYACAAIMFRYMQEKCDINNKFDKITVKNCKIENVYGCGIRFHDLGLDITDEYANAYFSNVLIEDTTIDTTSADGVILQNCYKPVVRRCKIFRVGVLEPEGSTNFHCAVWGCAVESPLYEYNEVAYTKYSGGDGQAFDMDWGSKGTSVWQYNYTHDNEGGVILRHEDFKGIYRFNISVNDGKNSVGRGLIFHSSTGTGAKENLYFYNNVFYCDNTVDMRITHGFTAWPEWSAYSTNRNIFKNNIFMFANSDVDWGDNNVYSGNCYRGGAGYNSPANDSGAILANPLFADLTKVPLSREEAAKAFALQAGSPCIGKAKTLTESEKFGWEGKNFASEEKTDNVGAL